MKENKLVELSMDFSVDQTNINTNTLKVSPASHLVFPMKI